MKGVLRVKILKMLGIVFATIFGVAGSVFGVMAAMGKFKTPVVYPTVLEFAIEEQIIIEGKTYNPELDWETQFEDKENSPKIESFILKGTNPDSEHEVNKTKCYIWFEEAESTNLITLCDKNGKPLTPNSSLRYVVNCNEPIYYVVNEVDGEELIDGKVVLYARSENETLKRPEKPMTIWIDRKVESVFVDYSRDTINKENFKHQIDLGIDMGFDFKYLVDTPLSLEPISKESAKEIELYYVTTNKEQDYGTDYYRVTPSSCADDNLSSPVADILEYKDGTYRFQSSKAGNHQFILAVFPTYQSKTEYFTSIEGLQIENPNFHKTQSMLTTELNVTVEDIEISKAGLSGSNIVLDLYSEENYIYLDNENDDNDLGLYMKKGVAPNQIDDYTRFDEVKMGALSSSISDKTPTFITEEGVAWSGGSIISENVNIIRTNKYLSTNLVIIDYITVVESDVKYFCDNGVAVLDTKGNLDDSDDTVKLLTAGSYLDFYVENTVGNSKTYTLADFDYEATPEGTGRDKKWQITTKELPEGEEIYIGILVVNNSGIFDITNYYSVIKVEINELKLSYGYNSYDNNNVKFTTNNAIADFNITFDQLKTYYPDVTFDNLISINKGTYTNYVYVIKADGVTKENCIIDIFDNIMYKDGLNNVYYVVGYTDSDGNFVNGIKVNGNVSKDNQTCSIYMLQLKHEYGKNINDIITSGEDGVMTLGKTFAEEEVVELEDRAIVVNAKYIVNTNLLTYTYGNDFDNVRENDSVYENLGGKELTIASTNFNMLDKIIEFYAINEQSIKATSQYSARVDFASLSHTSDAGLIVISYNVGAALPDKQDLTLDVWLEFGNGVEYELGTITILNGSPDAIVLKSNATEITLSNTSNDVNQNEYIYATLLYDTSKGVFDYEFYVNVGATKQKVSKGIFNKTIDSTATVGFQSDTNKQQSFAVSYKSSDKTIFNSDEITFGESGEVQFGNNLILKSGEVVLEVTIGETRGYIKLVTDTGAFSLATVGNELEFDYEGKNSDLSDFVTLSYNSKYYLGQTNKSSIDLTNGNLVKVTNVKQVQDNKHETYLSFQDENGNWLLKKSSTDENPILSIYDEGNGWKLLKNHYYIPLSITLEVETVAGSVEIKINFTSSINISVSKYWSDRTIYAGTKISLHGTAYEGSNVYSSGTEYSMFQVVKATGVNAGVGFKVKDGDVLDNEFILRDDHIGEVVIVPTIDGNPIETEFVFSVKPNVIATINNKNLTSETTYALNDIYDLKAYKTDVTFGESAASLYTKTVYYADSTYTEEAEVGEITDYYKIINNEDCLETLADTKNLEFKASAGTDPEIIASTRLDIKEMRYLTVEETREIKLVYLGVELIKDLFTIENKHSVVITDTDDNDADQVLNFKALKEYDIFASVTGFELQSIVVDNINFVIGNGKFIIDTIINQEYEDVELELTFKKEEGEQLLIYLCKVNVLPYTPETKTTFDLAYSGTSYDLFGGIYSASAIEEDVNIKKLYVTGVKYDDSLVAENVASTLISNWSEGGSGYVTGVTGPACVVNFKEISGDNLQVYVEFSVTYTNGATYVYYIPLTISNRQALSDAQYPESELELSNGTFKFLQKYEQDALNISGLTQAPVDGIYSLNNLSYEPMLIYTNSSTELNFKYDNIKKLSRFVVDNYDGSASDRNLTVELIGYQNNGGMTDYISKINNGVNSITLPSAQQGMFGMLIFKVLTVSGNYEYYNVYVYCKGATSNVNYANNLEVVYYDNQTNYEYLDSPENTLSLVKTNTDATTYVGLVKAIEADVFYSTFKTEYNENTTNVYLYNGVYTGEEETDADSYDYKGAQWIKLTNETINVDEHFNVVTLGLVMDDGVQEYCYGTITVYVQPSNSVAIDGSVSNQFNIGGTDTLKYELPNGYLTADVKADLVQIQSPFGIDWEAVVDETQLVKGEGSIVILKKRVPEDTEIFVKYIKNETIVYVTYTYKATIIPEQTSSVITVGEFVDETTGFDSSVNILTQQFLGTYNGDYTVSIGETVTVDNTFTLTKTAIYLDMFETIAITFIDDVLTFPQTHEEQTFKVTITYTDFNSNNKTRTFTFKVLPGYEFASTASGEGLSSSNRVKTQAKNDYTSTECYKGSTLSFNETSLNEGKLFKYEVASLIIYTNANAKLVLTFDENSYILNLEDNKFELSTNGNVDFVHSAVDKNITMTISVVEDKSEGQEFAKRNLYLTVAKTYSTLKAVYLTDGADHENVAKGSEVKDIHSTLMKNEEGGRRQVVVLVDNAGVEQPDADLLTMGFATYGNPNFIEFSTKSYATIKTVKSGDEFVQNDIQFNTVSTNTKCSVYLNNKAGIEAGTVEYIYQIMASTKVDGLNYNSTSGYNGTAETSPYISFVLDDRDSTKAYSKKFVVGTMNDLLNETVFSYGDKTPESTLVEYENAIQYKEETTGSAKYTLYLTLNLDTKQVELLVMRAAGDSGIINKIVLNDINLGGVNGPKTIATNLTIVLSNYNIVENYNRTLDEVYAGFEIDLFKDGKFVQNGSSTSTLTYELADSSYDIKGETYTIKASQVSNDLFDYDKDTKVIKTNAVANDAVATINFLVKDGDYVIKTVTYKLNIYMNMKFVVNGDETSSLETDFILTNKATKDATEGTSFPMTVNFIPGSAVKAEDIKATSKINYYKVLSFDLYRLKTQKNGLIIDRNNVVVTLNSDISGDVLKVTNTGIQFFKDFSGEIELKLSATTRNGTYVQYWTIYVTPIVEIDLAKTESTILQTKSSSAFSSGASVNLISDINNKGHEDVGVVVDSDSNFKDYINNGGVSVHYEYKIYTFAENSGISGLTSKQLFNLENSSAYYQYYVAEGNNNGNDDKLNEHSFAISLPNVPSTLDVQSYLVVYEVYVEYLGLTRAESEVEVFYITYNVINKQRVENYQYQIDNSSDVWYASDDVDISTRVDNVTDDTKHYLDLFYYKEEFENTASYVLTYSGGEISLSIDGATSLVGTTSGDDIIFNDGEYKYNPANCQLSKRNAADTSKYDNLGTMEATEHYSTTYYSVFKSNFTNIVEFKNFIDLYLDKESVKIDDKSFKLVEIANGRYGIDLNENDGVLITNELDAKLSLVVDGVETVSLPDFKLFVEGKITPQGSTYSINDMGLSSYFTPKTDWNDKLTIIGLGTPTTAWVSNASSCILDDTAVYGIISIPNGTGNTEYELHKVTYNGDGSRLYYSITKDYYYIKETKLAVPSYTGIESYLYSVAYNPDENGNVVLDLSSAVKVWTMNANNQLVASDSVSYTGYSAPTVEGITNPTHNEADKTLTLAASKLQAYKAQHPEAKTYPRIRATIKANNITLQLVIEFALPTE